MKVCDLTEATHSAERDHIEGVSSSIDLIKKTAVSAVRGVVDLQLVSGVPKDREMFKSQKLCTDINANDKPFFFKSNLFIQSKYVLMEWHDNSESALKTLTSLQQNTLKGKQDIIYMMKASLIAFICY